MTVIMQDDHLTAGAWAARDITRIWGASANGNRRKGAKFEQYERTITKRIYYSPHHVVVRKAQETTKVPIVSDGSAKNSMEERSLNDCLEVGGNHIPHIFDMLTKFRWNTVGLTADIEKAFFNGGHQTRRSRHAPIFMVPRSVHEETRDCRV